MRIFKLHIILIYISALWWMGGSVIAQTNLPVNGQTLYQIGYNAGGADAGENTELVTTGGVTRYWLYPDLSLNPGYDVAFPLATPLTSSFSWGLTNITGSANAVIAAVGAYGSYTNYKQITWSGTGTADIGATESSAGCSGTPVEIPVQVLAAPDVTAIAFSTLGCPTGTNGSYTLAGPTVTLTISCGVPGAKGVSVVWSLDGPGTFSDLSGQTVSLGNNVTIDLSGINLTHAGTYTFTINTITDRIATKSGLTTIADGTNNTFIVYPAPVTEPAKHVNNNLAW